MNKPDYIGHRQRLMKKYRKTGFSGWHDYEILEFILTYVIPVKNTKPPARALLRKFGSLGSVFNAGEKELVEIEGIGPRSAMFLGLFREIASIYLESRVKKTNFLSSPKAVYDYLAVSLKGKREEEFKAIFVDSRNHPVAMETIQTGTVNKSAIYPRKVVESAIKHNAVSIIVAHNHPGGSLKPSQDDLQITEIIREALEVIEISLLDHIIVSSEGYFSFREKGLIAGIET